MSAPTVHSTDRSTAHPESVLHPHVTTVCALDDLEENLGAAVLLPDGTQVALFRISDETPGSSGVYAVSNIDPYMGAAVMSRGIIGEYQGEPTVASPLLKQRFRLEDGTSVEDESHVLPIHEVELIADGDQRSVLVHY